MTSWRAIASATPAGVNIGTITWVPPTTLRATHAAPSARWNIGAACRRRPPGVMNEPEAALPSADASRFAWLSTTPLGVPVVPPV